MKLEVVFLWNINNIMAKNQRGLAIKLVEKIFFYAVLAWKIDAVFASCTLCNGQHHIFREVGLSINQTLWINSDDFHSIFYGDLMWAFNFPLYGVIISNEVDEDMINLTRSSSTIFRYGTETLDWTIYNVGFLIEGSVGYRFIGSSSHWGEEPREAFVDSGLCACIHRSMKNSIDGSREENRDVAKSTMPEWFTSLCHTIGANNIWWETKPSYLIIDVPIVIWQLGVYMHLYIGKPHASHPYRHRVSIDVVLRS